LSNGEKKITRRQFLKGSALLGAGAVIGLGAYGAMVEPHALVTEHVTVQLRRLPPALAGFTIAQISDIHYGDFVNEPHLRNVVQEINALSPDLVVITGDFISHGRWRTRDKDVKPGEPCARILGELRPKFFTAAVLGNNDNETRPKVLTAWLERNGISVLQNRAVAVEHHGARLWLAGVDDVLTYKANFAATFDPLPQDEPRITLLHEPDAIDNMHEQGYFTDLQLSGHSHGGRVRIPLLGAPMLPRLARKYPMGHYRVGDMQLYTNRGIGMVAVPLRLNCPPEITLLTLKRAEE
jgi:hypothetical protein